MAFGLVIDPDGTSLNLHDRANGIWVVGFDNGNAELETQYASSADTEGARVANSRPLNRTVTVSVLMQASTAAALQALENTVDQKVGKLNREGGELQLTTSAGGTFTFDVLQAVARRAWTPDAVATHRAARDLELVCLPYGRGAEQDLGDNAETTLPALVFSESSVPGDVDALGRLVIDDDSGNDQWFVAYGVENDALYTHSTASGGAALFYEAESRTALGGAAATAVASASGGTVVRQGTLTPTDQAILSTQASGGGAHLSHVGTFRVFARAQVATANAGTVSLSLAWGVGDFRNATVNEPVTLGDQPWVSNAVWRLVDLGIVTIPAARAGATQRWEGRILGRSTSAGDDVDIDYLMFIPVGGSSGDLSAVANFQTPTSFSARDEFDQSAGTLTAKVLPVGGTWAGAGDADDFSVETTGHTAQRTAVSDTTGVAAIIGGRVAIAGTATYSTVYVQVAGQYTAATITPEWGVFARYTDQNNWLEAKISTGTTSTVATITKRVAGTSAVLASLVSPGSGLHPAGTERVMRLQVDDQGRVFMWVWADGLSPGAPILSTQHSDLATGGSLASGKVGFFDHHDSANACTRNYDDFVAAVPVKDAAIFASQSLEVTHEQAQREDSAGSFWVPVSSVVGDYLLVPPAGNEGRTTRVIVKACRNDPDTMPDAAIDDISAKLLVIPRYLHVPE